MKPIKVTSALRSAIFQAARKEVSGASPFFEVGYREKVGSSNRCSRSAPARVCGGETTNMRLWEEEADLIDMIPLRELAALELDEGGLCELDLYATTTQASRGSFMGGRQLETNVYVMLDETGVLDTSSVGREYRKTWAKPEREAPARLRPSELRVGMVTPYGYTVTHNPGHSSPGGRIIVGVRYLNGDTGVREWERDEPCVTINQ